MLSQGHQPHTIEIMLSPIPRTQRLNSLAGLIVPFRSVARSCRLGWRVALTGLIMLLAWESAPAATITVNGQTTYQTIDGFGVNINHRSWNPNELPPVIDALVDQAGMTLFRVLYDNTDWEAVNDNSSSTSFNWSYYNTIYNSAEFNKLWDLSAYLNSKGITDGLIFNFQGPGPTWLMTSSDPNQADLASGNEDEWAEMVTSLFYYARNTKGIQFSSVMPNNEPDQFPQGIRVQSAGQYGTTLHDLSAKLDANGMSDVKIVGPDLAFTDLNFLSTMTGDASIMSKIQHFSIHGYSAGAGNPSGVLSFISGSAYSNRNLWVSEFNVACSVCDYGQRGTYDWAYCEGTANYLLTYLADNVSAGIIWEGYDSYYLIPNVGPQGQWSYWGLFSIDDINAPVKTYTPRKNFYTVAQISKFVRPGAQRIDVSGSTSPFSPLLAFKHTALGQVTVVGINTSSSSATLSCTLQSAPAVTSMDLYYTSSTVNMVHSATVAVTNGSFSATIPADCVFTLTGTAGVNVSITSPASGARFSAPAAIPITATATTASGSIEEVDFFNGSTSLGADLNSPYQFNWNSVPMGDYVLTAAANDTTGHTGVSNGVNVSVVGPLSQITVVPGSAVVVAGAAQQFTASGTDAMGHSVIGTPVFSWSVSGGGSIDSTGKFTAGATAGGPFNVVASSGGVSGTSTVTVTSSGSGTVGNTANGTLTDNIWSGGAWINASRFQAGTTISAAALMAKVGAVTGKYKCAIYSDVSGLPSRLVQTTAEVTAPAAGWQTFTLTAPVALTSGTYYWLTIWSNDSNARVYYSGTNGTLRWASGTYGTWPDPISTSGGSNLNYCIYAVAGSGPSLTSIAVTPATPSISNGTTQQFTATGTYSDATTQNISSTVTWGSANTGVATITTAGKATGVAAGTSAITAALNGVSGGTTLTVTPALTLTSIALTPANPSLTIGGTQQFTATGTYSNGSTQNLSALVTWGSSVPAHATITTAGLATAVSGGATTISASVSGVTGTTTLTVQTTALSITTNSTPNGTGNVPYSAALAATGGTTPYAWSVTAGALPGGLTLNASTGVIAGTPSAAGTFSFTVKVTDSGSPVLSATANFGITISAAATTYTVWPATAKPTLVDGGADSSVELGVKIQSDVTGTITGIRFYKASTNTGTHVGNLWSSAGNLLASATFSGESSSGWQQVNFSSPVTIAANTVYVASYHATSGHYSADVNYFASAGVDNVPLHALRNGVSGGDGVYRYGSGNQFPNSTWNSANYWVDVVFAPNGPPALASIAVTPGNPTIINGSNQQFAATGTYSDSSTQNLTTQVTWGSTNTTVATVNANGLASSSSVGTTTVSAALNGIAGTTLLTVKAPVVLASIAVTPSNPTVTIGATLQFAATGTYSDSSTQNLTSQVTWNSSTTSRATITSGGLASGVSAGTTTISATLGAISGNTGLTVQPPPLSITTGSLAGGTVGTSYSATLAGTGGTTPYSWSVSSGALPAGLNLNAGTGAITGTPTASGTATFTAQLLDSGNPVQSTTKALSITIASGTPTPVTIWPSTAKPTLVDGGADSSVELGVKFQSDVAGTITGIRFYKASTNTGTHVAHLWSSTGTLLASATFAGETASGWQQVTFSSPVTIAANTVYVASYHVGSGHYSADVNYFTSAGVDNAPLHALRNGVSGGNGVYTYGSGSPFPTSTWMTANYWVDVVFLSSGS
jgi:O-glycosyl hydrolase